MKICFRWGTVRKRNKVLYLVSWVLQTCNLFMRYFSERHSQNEYTGFYLTVNKMHIEIIKIKVPTTNKHTNKKNPFSLASNIFQCCRRCLHTTAIYCSRCSCAHAPLGRYNFYVLRHSSAFWQMACCCC